MRLGFCWIIWTRRKSKATSQWMSQDQRCQTLIQLKIVSDKTRNRSKELFSKWCLGKSSSQHLTRVSRSGGLSSSLIRAMLRLHDHNHREEQHSKPKLTRCSPAQCIWQWRTLQTEQKDSRSSGSHTERMRLWKTIGTCWKRNMLEANIWAKKLTTAVAKSRNTPAKSKRSVSKMRCEGWSMRTVKSLRPQKKTNCKAK